MKASMTTNTPAAGEMPVVAYLVTGLARGEPSICFEDERGDYGDEDHTPVFDELIRKSDHDRVIAAKDAEIARLQGDARRLDYILQNDAFKHATRTDAGGVAYQLMAQDEDEDYTVLSGADKFFASPRAAIDAAIDAASQPTGNGDEQR